MSSLDYRISLLEALHLSTVGHVFAAATKWVFYQDTAPDGWTIQNTLDDKLVYITKGSAAGGETGGGVHSTGSWTISGITQTGHTHAGPSHTHVGSAHTHALYNAGPAGPGGKGIGDAGAITIDGGYICGTGDNGGGGYQNPSSTTTTSGAAATGAGGTGATGSATPAISHSGTWRPSAYCCIICSKN
jgi:hypothetical protein